MTTPDLLFARVGSAVGRIAEVGDSASSLAVKGFEPVDQWVHRQRDVACEVGGRVRSIIGVANIGRNGARQSGWLFHAHSGENSRGKVQNVVVNCSAEYAAHYHAERPHQSLDNEPLKKPKKLGRPQTNRGNLEDEIVPLSEIRCKQRLGGLLKSYSRKAA